tara:strand:+ start:21983 stop:22432 length:450 start_codon:yes stop_codon:yes gene_type:complete
LINSLDRQLGVRESGGNNRGWKVNQYQESTGSKDGESWCSSYVHWNLTRCGIPNTVTAWSPTSFNKKNIVWYQGKFKKTPREGDVFSLYSLSKKRIAHTGFVRERLNEKFYLTNEGNAAQDGALNPYDGDGVYEKIRSFNSTHAISRWE